jgi:TfoX/Sxy family transcriptional regulator of competence genes
MAFDEKLADKIREALVHLPNVEEKYMFGGVCFMVDGKMCIGVVKEEMMCRIDPALDEIVMEKKGCRPMDFTKRPMKGYVFINREGMRSKKDFNYWIELCLAFNSSAKPSRKKSKKISAKEVNEIK